MVCEPQIAAEPDDDRLGHECLSLEQKLERWIAAAGSMSSVEQEIENCLGLLLDALHLRGGVSEAAAAVRSPSARNFGATSNTQVEFIRHAVDAGDRHLAVFPGPFRNFVALLVRLDTDHLRSGGIHDGDHFDVVLAGLAR